MNCRRTAHLLATLLIPALSAISAEIEVKPVSPEQVAEYKLVPSFYKKATLVQDILIATSANVPDVVHLEAAYQFDMVMRSIKPAVAQRIRDKKVLCVLVGHRELTSDVPQFASDKTGKELDFYNWRERGFLSMVEGRRVVLFSEEDVLEYEGGMQLESILIHEFGHVIDGAGFDQELRADSRSPSSTQRRRGCIRMAMPRRGFAG